MSTVLAIWVNNIQAAEIDVVAGAGFTLRYTQEWLKHEKKFPFSPHLPLGQTSGGAEVKNFFENLLPEGSALDVAASMHNLSKHDAFGLLAKIGREAAGAMSIIPINATPDMHITLRPLPLDEIAQRIRERPHKSFSAWDSKVRLSIAGYQDKLAVFINHDQQMHLPDDGASSTHIIKPENINQSLPFMPANEHFCMCLAQALKLPVPKTDLLHIPVPLYVIERYDRQKERDGQVSRLHQIDLCQVLNLPVEMKYQQSYEFSPEGASYADLFQAADSTTNPAKTKMALLRWIVFNYMIGNTDAHAKNVSFFLDHTGLRLAPFYDLVSGTIYGLKNMALFIGKEEEIGLVSAIDWMEFCQQCGLHSTLLSKELRTQANQWGKLSTQLLHDEVFALEEKNFLFGLAADIEGRVHLMQQQALNLVLSR
jgi:serine/threonine-protein kinase HipA